MQESCLQTGDAFLLVFSVTDRRSFTRVPPTLLRLRAGSPQTDPPIILVGNKSDLARSREVSREGEWLPCQVHGLSLHCWDWITPPGTFPPGLIAANLIFIGGGEI